LRCLLGDARRQRAIGATIQATPCAGRGGAWDAILRGAIKTPWSEQFSRRWHATLRQ
jgi:hypothetical protein